MTKSLRAAVFIWVAAAVTAVAGAPTVNYTQTNVLQNVAVQLTLYQQGATNHTGTKVADQVTSYATKNLITNLAAAAGQQFGNGAKLVLSTVYANVTNVVGSATYSNYFSNNLVLATNSTLTIPGLHIPIPLSTFLLSGPVVIDGDLVSGFSEASTNIITETTGANVQTVTIKTNSQYITTITPSTNSSNVLTGASIVTQFQVSAAPTQTVLTNVSSSVDVLYGGTANALTPVTNFITFSSGICSDPVPPEIVVESGNGLNTTNALTVGNLSSQTALTLQSLTINYSYPAGLGVTNMLSLDLEGFVKQTLKVDTLYSHGTNKVIEDIFGGGSTWNVFGQGFAGSAANPAPVLAEGTITISFLKNLPQ